MDGDEVLMRTYEEIIKFDSGLKIGTSLVNIECRGHSRKALVEISRRGRVALLFEPRLDEMYTSWRVIKENKTAKFLNTIVWGARDPECRKMFDGEPVATIKLEN